MHCTKISAEFESGCHSLPWVRTLRNVALDYDVGKISTGCLVTITVVIYSNYADTVRINYNYIHYQYMETGYHLHNFIYTQQYGDIRSHRYIDSTIYFIDAGSEMKLNKLEVRTEMRIMGNPAEPAGIPPGWKLMLRDSRAVET